MLDQWRSIPIFAGLDEAALAMLSERALQTEALAGQIVLREGAAGNRVFLIQTGMVRVIKNFGLADEKQLALLQKGDFFGEMCILETLPRSASIQAVTDAAFLSITSITFLDLYEQMPRQYGLLVLNIARDVSRRLRKLDEKFSAQH